MGISNRDTLTKGKQVSVTKIPKIKKDLFPKEVGLQSNKTRAKEAWIFIKDKVLLRVLQGRSSVKSK